MKIELTFDVEIETSLDDDMTEKDEEFLIDLISEPVADVIRTARIPTLHFRKPFSTEMVEAKIRICDPPDEDL